MRTPASTDINTRQRGDTDGIAFSPLQLGQLARFQDNLTQAALLFEETLLLCQKHDDTVESAESLMGFAGRAAAQGQVVRAVQILGALEALIDTSGVRRVDAERLQLDRSIATV